MTELFSHNDSTKHTPAKAPTTYKFFEKPTAAQKKGLYAVELIFMPSGRIGSWGFIAQECRFNIYDKDSRYSEIADAISDVRKNKQELFIKYSPNDRGLATLIIGKSEKVVWEQRGDNMLTATY